MEANAQKAAILSLDSRMRLDQLRTSIGARPVRWVAGYTILIIVTCGVIYSLIEAKTSIPDGLYWAIVTASTVGYGDISPVEIEGRLLAGFVILNGIAVAALLTALFASWLLEGKLEDHLGTPDLHDDFDDMIGQLQALKQRYVQDEDADDRIAEAAREAHRAWKTSPDGEQCDRAMATLERALRHDY